MFLSSCFDWFTSRKSTRYILKVKKISLVVYIVPNTADRGSDVGQTSLKLMTKGGSGCFALYVVHYSMYTVHKASPRFSGSRCFGNVNPFRVYAFVIKTDFCEFSKMHNLNFVPELKN